jgi:tRNA (guanine-N7-)-methyltransferase
LRKKEPMGKDKLKRFAEMKTFRNVFQCFSYESAKAVDFQDNEISTKGFWNKGFFKNNHPIVLELACGKGEYTVALARKFPEKNFIGIDIKGARIHKGAKDALQENLENVAFLRAKIQLIDRFFDENEVSEIWITFCDPFPKDKHEKHRLTSPGFLDLYRKVAVKDARVHLKHDSTEFFDYSLEVVKNQGLEILKEERDIYTNGASDSILTEVQTHYEKSHLQKGKTINYLQFKLNKS